MVERQPISLDPQAYKNRREEWSGRTISLEGEMLTRTSHPLPLQLGLFTENEQRVITALYRQSTSPNPQPATLAEIAHNIFGDTVTPQDRETRVFRALANMQNQGKLQGLGLSLSVEGQEVLDAVPAQNNGNLEGSANAVKDTVVEAPQVQKKPSRPKKEMHITEDGEEFWEDDESELRDDGELIRGLVVPETQTLFFRRLRKYPLLNKDLEWVLFDRMDAGMALDDLRDDDIFWSWVEDGQVEKFENVLEDSREIEDLILNCNLRLVVRQAKKHQGRGIPLMDLIQEGQIGLLKAIENFDHESGFNFSTYATWCVKGRMRNAIRSEGRMIRLPAHIEDALNVARKGMAEFYMKNGRNMTTEDVERFLLYDADRELPLKQASIKGAIAVLKSPGTLSIRSLDTPTGDDEEDTVGDSVADPTPTAEEIITSIDERTDLIETVREEVRKALDPRECRIVYLRAARWTLQDIAREYGLTRERIRQIEAIALNKLKDNERLRRQWESMGKLTKILKSQYNIF